MKKEDLKFGNVVELRCEGMCVACEFGINTILINLDGKHHKHINNIDSANIMKVYKDYTLKELLWERKEKPKLTEDGKVILRNIPKNYKWIARDEDGELNIYENEPYKNTCYWIYDYGDACDISIFERLFQFIKWEDKEPYKISELLEE